MLTWLRSPQMVFALVLVAMGLSGWRVTAADVQGPTSPSETVRHEARDIFARLISFETSIGKGQVPQAAEWLAERFRAAGFSSNDVHVLPLGETASLVVRYRGDGTGGRPIAFLAHLDVVTAKREDWQRDPFALVEEKGYFFGRGTADIKCEVALLTATFLRLKAENFVPTRDLILAFTGDEETGMRTTEDLVTRHRALINAEFALNGDGGGGTLAEADGRPVSYVVQGAEKTAVNFRLTVRNPGGHSSRPRADNAIYELADALQALRHYHFPVKWNDWTLDNFRTASVVTPAPVGPALARFVAHPGDPDAVEEILMDPSFANLICTTCVATMLSAGHAANALPQSATATVNCRIFPGTTIAEVQSALQNLAGPNTEIAPGSQTAVADASPMRDDVLRAVTHAVTAAHPGATVSGAMAAYATDGSVFRHAGVPTYGVSSIFAKDSEDFSHGLNERIPVASFYAGLTHWYIIIRDLAAKH
jgi:acetylornithine deacetylase/succinyl-diaminopimelate desuccinylase-like protein